MTKKTLLLVFLFASITLAGCSGKGEQQAAQTPAQQEARVKKFHIDMKEEERLQEASDMGAQAWRKNPSEVAHAALIGEAINVKPDDCKVVEEGKEDCLVKARVKENDFFVRLKRLIKKDGIWTATEIKVEGPELSKAPMDEHNVHQHGGQEHQGHMDENMDHSDHAVHDMAGHGH